MESNLYLETKQKNTLHLFAFYPTEECTHSFQKMLQSDTFDMTFPAATSKLPSLKPVNREEIAQPTHFVVSKVQARSYSGLYPQKQ